MHFGKREVLSRIEAMEVEYDEPLAYVDPGPAMPGDEPTGDLSQPWGDGIVVWGGFAAPKVSADPKFDGRQLPLSRRGGVGQGTAIPQIPRRMAA